MTNPLSQILNSGSHGFVRAADGLDFPQSTQAGDVHRLLPGKNRIVKEQLETDAAINQLSQLLR